ncbi:MAG: BrnT family toxin [Sulfuritalea sp.]|nr:BrnT family toxin [Sulfuritalea sp.]
MSAHILWDEAKRQANLDKHGLDFVDATMVLESPYRPDVGCVRGGEARMQSFPMCSTCWRRWPTA